MKLLARIKKDSISLKATHSAMILITIAMMILLLIGVVQTGFIYQRLTDTTDQYTQLQDAARDLMDASDYLTDKVQRFTVTLDPADMDAYFDEAEHVQRRDNALDTM